MTTQRYPLAWPTGWPRTRTRKAASFRKTRQVAYTGGQGYYRQAESLGVGDATSRLAGELRRLGVRDGDWLISSDLRVRIDGLPYAQQANPADPGVAVYFRLKGQDRVLACDTWMRIADNIAAIAAHIECLRGIDRYKVGTMEQAFAGYAALPSKGTTWRTTLGFAPDQVVTADDIADAFKVRARTSHPDVEGGSHDAMASLVAARDEGLAEVKLGRSA